MHARLAIFDSTTRGVEEGRHWGLVEYPEWNGEQRSNVSMIGSGKRDEKPISVHWLVYCAS